MTTRRICPLAVVLLFMVVALSACEEQVDRKDTPLSITLGVIGPFSGDNKQWGESGLLGVKTAIAYQQERNRKLQVELVEEDDQSNPELAKVAFVKLAIEDQVDAILVLSGSKTMLGLAELADQYEIPVVSTLSSHPQVTENGWVSQIVFDDRSQGTVAAFFVIDELLIQRVSMVWDGEDPHSKALAESFRRAYQEAGGSVVSVDISARKDDYRKVMDQLQKSNVGFVYLPVEVGHVVDFEQTAREIGYNPQVLLSDGVLSQMMLEYADNLNLLEGMLATDIFTNEVPLSEFGESVTIKFEKLFNVPGTTITGLGCEGVHAVLTAVEKCGKNPQNECINRMIRSGNEFEGLLEPFIIDLDGKADRPVYINKIKNKRLRFLLKVN